MTPEEFDKLHAAFREATINFFRNVAQLNASGLPFTVRVDDKHGQNLLYARIERTPEGLLYLNEDDIGTVYPDEDHTEG